MFDGLSSRLQETMKRLKGQARLTEDNIQDALREVRMALLEADVALPVVREFVKDVKEKALGQEVIGSLTPGQALIKVVHDELIATMGGENASLNLAAIQQLETLAGQVEVTFYPSDISQKPEAIASEAVTRARRDGTEVLLVDTAGRLHVDEDMMAEVKALHQAIDPIETLFVVDSMTGQDAANTARAFGEALPLTGVVLTKADGDARGGAALSVRQITGVPIKFIGMGERPDALEPFHPERIASRILGKGDVLSLVEEASRQVDQDKAAKLTRKLKKGRGFDLNDLREQLGQMQKMGGISSMLEKLPGGGKLPDAVKNQANDKEIGRMMAVISSMTEHERRHPDVIKGSRKRRIAAGSGTQIQDVNRLLKQHAQMSKAMKKFSKGGASKMMRALGGKMGGMGGMGGPGGGMPFR